MRASFSKPLGGSWAVVRHNAQMFQHCLSKQTLCRRGCEPLECQFRTSCSRFSSSTERRQIASGAPGLALSEIKDPGAESRVRGPPSCSTASRITAKSIASRSELTSGADQLDLADRGSACCGQLCGALDYSDRQHLPLAADLDLMQRTPGKVESGARHRLVGNNKFAGKVLGQGFESARGIDGA